jgi:hypothetical protein
MAFINLLITVYKNPGTFPKNYAGKQKAFLRHGGTVITAAF